MKKILLILSTIFIAAGILAQVPEKMSYQAVVRNSKNSLIANQPIGLRISIIQGTINGPQVYAEIFHPNPVTNSNGLFTAEIGSGTPVLSTFSSINWINGPYFIQAEIDTAGGTNYMLTATTQILSVPYALHAKTAEAISGTITESDPAFAAWDKDYNDIINKPDLSFYATKNMANQNITNLADPVKAQDAATKAYVDELLKKIVEIINDTLLAGGFIDARDGNYYKMVKIGNQTWMAENLKYMPEVTFPDIYVGFTPVPNPIYANLGFKQGPYLRGHSSDTIPYYYVYGYIGTKVNEAKATDNYNTYGVLYNWPSAMNGASPSSLNPSGVQGVCPAGWHLPSRAEWEQLVDYLGGEDIAGGKLKETGTTHWESPNTGATNESGFTALPGGQISNQNEVYQAFEFSKVVNCGFWWSTTWNDNYISSESFSVCHSSKNIEFNSDGEFAPMPKNGLSVRCVKD